VVPYSWRRSGPLVVAGDSCQVFSNFDEKSKQKVARECLLALRDCRTNVILKGLSMLLHDEQPILDPVPPRPSRCLILCHD
jgi:hypothetical protein